MRGKRLLIAIVCLCMALTALPAMAENWFAPAASTALLPAGTDVFEFNLLSPTLVQSSSMVNSGEYQIYTVNLQPNVNAGGSTGYTRSWVTESGVLCETALDLDGDGVNELLTYTVDPTGNTSFGVSYPRNSLIVYELMGGAYSEAGRIDNAGSMMPAGDSAIRVVTTGANSVLLAVIDQSFGDGAVNDLSVKLYSYNGFGISAPVKAHVTDKGTSWIMNGADVNTDSQNWEAALYAYEYRSDATALTALGLTLDQNVYIYPHDAATAGYTYDGLDRLAEVLKNYGMGLTYHASASGYCDDITVSGGKVLFSANDNNTNAVTFQLLTAADHKPGVLTTSVVPVSGVGEKDATATGAAATGTVTGQSKVTTTADANLRDNAGTNSNVITVIPKGTSVAFTGEYATDSNGGRWYKVAYNGNNGWVSSAYAQLGSGTVSASSNGSSSGSTAKSGSSSGSNSAKTTGSANLRKTPNLNGDLLGVVPQGASVTFLGGVSTDSRGVKWYNVSYNGKTGWISSKYTSLNGSSGSSSSSQSAYTTGNVNLRKSPNTSGGIIDTIPNGASVTYLGNSTTDSKGIKWYYVRYNGKDGWAAASYVKMGSKPSSSSNTGSYTGVNGYATGDTNLRLSPNLNASIIATVPKGGIVNYLNDDAWDERGVKWYYVRYNGETGWVSSKYVKGGYTDGSGSSSGGGSGSSSTPSGTGYTTGDTNLRKYPNLDSSDDIITTIPSGKSVTYLGESWIDGRGVPWYYVDYNGTKGWASSKYVKLNGGSSSGSSSSSGGSSSSGSSSSGSWTSKSTGIYGYTTGDTNLRKYPNIDSSDDIITTIPSGKTVEYRGESWIDGRGVKWYYVRYNGIDGWASSKYVKAAGSSGGGSSSGGSSSSSGSGYTTGDTNLRTNPNLNGSIITSIPSGKSVTYLGSTSTDDRGVKWYYVSYKGNSGWVSSKYTKLN